MDKKFGVEQEDTREHDLIVAVVARGFSDYVVSAARDAGATGATIIYGRGTSDFDMQVMGVSIQPEREVVLILVKHNERRKIMQEIADKTSVLEVGRGICFSLPVTQVYGLAGAEMHKMKQIKRAEELNKIKKNKSRSTKVD